MLGLYFQRDRQHQYCTGGSCTGWTAPVRAWRWSPSAPPRPFCPMRTSCWPIRSISAIFPSWCRTFCGKTAPLRPQAGVHPGHHGAVQRRQGGLRGKAAQAVRRGDHRRLHVQMPDSIADEKALKRNREQEMQLVRKAGEKLDAAARQFAAGKPPGRPGCGVPYGGPAGSAPLVLPEDAGLLQPAEN